MGPDVMDSGVAPGGMSPAECLEMVRAGAEALAEMEGVRHRLGSRELATMTRDVLAVLQLAENAAVGLVAEAVQRGVVSESTAGGAAQWVSRLSEGDDIDALLPRDEVKAAGPLVPLDEGSRYASPLGALLLDQRDGVGRRMPGVEPGVASCIAKVATACTQRRNEVLARAVAGHRVGVATARTALIEVEKVMRVLPGATRDQVFGHFLSLPPGAGAKAVRELSQRVIATFADKDFLDDLDAKLDAAETVEWAELPNGMHRLTADLAPLHAAQVKSALDALSAPAPGNTCCDDAFHRHLDGEKTGEVDPRSAGKRRADAFVMLVTRGAQDVDGDGAVRTSGVARIVVTIDQDVLSGRLRGCGRTEVGETLTAAQARLLACEAELLPMVLGRDSEPLDVGRAQRLVTPSMRAAVAQRDRCCTYPGCDRPPSWCQVHHVVPWSRGGPTSVENSALLCQRHHTVVHQQEYAAAVTATGVVWDLRPGSMGCVDEAA